VDFYYVDWEVFMKKKCYRCLRISFDALSFPRHQHHQILKLLIYRRKLQMNASRYLQNVLKILHSNQSSDLQLSSMNETLIVRDSLLLRWLLSNNFGTNFNINHSFRL
jgi:hypothetical protein